MRFISGVFLLHIINQKRRFGRTGILWTVISMLVLHQAAEPGEENPDGGRRDSCHCVRDEEAGGIVPGEIRGLEDTLVCRSVFSKVF